MSKIDINVKHITRVEGHGNIVVRADDGKIEKCEWQVPEAPRFFEAMVRGRHRFRLLVMCAREVDIQAYLRQWLGGVKARGSLRLNVDVDPYSFL